MESDNEVKEEKFTQDPGRFNEFINRFLNKLKKLEWQDWVLVAIILFLLALNFLLIQPLKQLPSPLYGGDYYHQLGSTYHISSSLNPFHWFTGSNILGSLPMELPVYGVSVSLFVWIFGLEPMQAEFAFSYIIVILSSVLIYILIKKLTSDKNIALLSVLLFVPIGWLPMIKYSMFATMVMIPWFLICIYDFYQEQNLKNSLILGLSYGLCSLSHPVAFITVNWIAFFIFFDLIFFRHYAYVEKILHKEELKRFFCENYHYFLIIYGIGLSFALLYWWKPIFVFHGKTLLGDQEWTMVSFHNFSVQIDYLFSLIKNYFFTFNSLKAIMMTVLVYPGMFVLFFSKNKGHLRFLKIILLAAVTLVFSYFITEPLIKTNFVPMHNNMFFLATTILLISLFGLKLIFNKLHFKLGGISLKNILTIILLIVLIFASISEFNTKKEDKWYQAGTQELPPQMLSLQKYLLANSDVDDAILSSNEVSFAVNALTGRKIVANRRAHNDKFLDFDKEEIKAAIILYGNDTSQKLDLIKNNNIRYLYWDYYWIQSEYYFDKNGQITGWFDPLVFRYPEIYGPILSQNGIKYFPQHTWLDPSAKTPDVIQYDLLFVSPENYRSADMPWKADLDPYLEEVWSYSQNSQKIARLFKIKA